MGARRSLDGHGIPYVTITHSPAFTAQEVAASAHVAGKELAKTVVVKLDDPDGDGGRASLREVDLAHLRDAAGAGTQGESIAFNAGPHTELVRISSLDFERLVHPKHVPLTAEP